MNKQPAIGLLDDLEHFAQQEQSAEANGRAAFNRGESVTTNPHERGSLQHEHWALGWHREKNASEHREFCIRCGKTELVSEQDKLTGICPDCWTPEDNEDGEAL